jgi:hypothetical protein
MVNVTMFKRVFALAALLLVVPVFASAQMPAEILKGGCNVTPTLTEHLFLVKNVSLTRVCQVRFTPMATTGCPILATVGPAGWSTTVNVDGSAVWTASTSANCVQTGSTKPGFSFSVGSTGNCCYFVDFMNAAGVVLYSTTRCCNCGPISVEDESWGQVKSKYQTEQ